MMATLDSEFREDEEDREVCGLEASIVDEYLNEEWQVVV
jgi:hypothetical protein